MHVNRFHLCPTVYSSFGDLFINRFYTEAQIVRLFDIRKELTARVEKLENDLETERNQPGPVSRYESRTRYAQSQEAELKQDLHSKSEENVRVDCLQLHLSIPCRILRNAIGFYRPFFDYPIRSAGTSSTFFVFLLPY